MIGQTLAHYRILEKLGEGGMGEVYLAEDTQLKRKVALKVLPGETASDPERLARFKREAESIAAINHPNIVTIYSVETTGDVKFLTMEWVDGKTLGAELVQGPLKLERVFELATPMADALAAAHEHGITHRDLKPANVMMNSRGQVKILDFGLAKLSEGAAQANGEMPTEPLTQKGLAVGTVPYMSPEQVRGESVDSRSDIFSLGVILYEMVAGRRPFEGKSSADLVSSILRDRPASVTDFNAELPHHLGRVIHRCLEKDPEKRYQTAKDVRNELEGLEDEVSSGMARLSSGTIPAAQAVAVEAAAMPSAVDATAPGKPKWLVPALAGAALLVIAVFLWSVLGGGGAEETGEVAATEAVSGSVSGIAQTEREKVIVLPFENLGQAEDEYFAAGIADEIYGRLASVSGLDLISRKTAGRYADTEKTIEQIGQELGVDYVLGGTVRWARGSGSGGTEGASRVRVAPELIRVADDTQVWTEMYDREIDDIFEVQADIASQVLGALDVTLLGNEQQALEARPTDNLEAYQFFLQAKNYDGGEEPFDQQDRRIIELFEKATQLDPSFVEAWTLLSRHHSIAYNTWDRTEERISRAKQALDSAADLGSDLPAVRLARGYYLYYGFRDYDRALEEYEAAAEALPNDSQVHQAMAFIQRRKGNLRACISGLEKAAVLDPQDFNIFAQLASTYRALRDTDNTLQSWDRAIALSPDNDSLYGDKAEAIVALTGDVAAGRRVLEEAPGTNPLALAAAWISQLFVERDYDEVIRTWDGLEFDLPLFKAFQLSIRGIAKGMRDDPNSAREDLLAAEVSLKEQISSSPSNDFLHQQLSQVYAFLGKDNSAVAEAKLAIDLTSKDVFAGPVARGNLAGIYALLGRTNEAVELIEILLASEYDRAMTSHTLDLEPAWDSIRNEPRFQALAK